MPTVAITHAELKHAVELVACAVRAGGLAPGQRGRGESAVTLAGRTLEREGKAPPGAGAQRIRHRLRLAKAAGVPLPWEASPKRHAPAPGEALRVALARGVADVQAPAQTVRVCVIPDVHLCPTNPDHSRMEWLGRWCADEEPDWVVQLGDLATFDSVSGHAPPGTESFAQLPRVRQDFEALERGLELFEEAARGLKARRLVTLGNHEERLVRFEDRNPQIVGLLTDRLSDLLDARGWATEPYRSIRKIAGVGFVHHPTNGAGRAYEGKTAAQRAANDAPFSLVHGHTHRRASVDSARIGGSSVRVISAGCALPWGHVEAYAQHSATGWWWGALSLTIRDGQILDEHFVSMWTLSRYGRSRSLSRKGPAR